MTSPNINATAQSVADDLAGFQRPYRQVASFFTSRLFGRNRDYAFPVGPIVGTDTKDHVVSLGKLLTRTRKMADGNEYDLHDAVYTILKSVLAANPHINDDEINSVNYKAKP